MEKVSLGDSFSLKYASMAKVWKKYGNTIVCFKVTRTSAYTFVAIGSNSKPQTGRSMNVSTDSGTWLDR